jgi:hypothetical protein
VSILSGGFLPILKLKRQFSIPQGLKKFRVLFFWLLVVLLMIFVQLGFILQAKKFSHISFLYMNLNTLDS